MSKVSHYFKRRKALKLLADRFLFEPLQPLPQIGQVLNPPAQPQTVIKPELPPQPIAPTPVQPQPQPTQIPITQPSSAQPVQTKPDEIIRTIQPMPQAARDVINRRLT